MEALKQVIAGQILLALVQLNPHKKDFTKEELKDYEDLKHCSEILLKDYKE